MPGAGRGRAAQPDRDPRRCRRSGCAACPGGGGRRPVRVLHPRSGDGDPRPPVPSSGGRPARDPRGPRRQPVPVHRLREGARRGGAGPPMSVSTVTRGGVGEAAIRPDGWPKARGEFAFSGDLWAEGMLWGHTLRSPHAAARIKAIDVGGAVAIDGVRAVLTAADVPGSPTYGLEHRDQPVFAGDVVRHHGEPVAVVAADHPATARRACAAIRVEYEPRAPLLDTALAEGADPVHPEGNVIRRLVINTGDPSTRGAIVVEGAYEVGMQDQAFMGPESALALPADDGGVDLIVSTQWLHNDRDQVAACLGLPPEKVRLTLGGVGGAFGAREDVSLHIHACLLALATGRPVKMVYSRTESFLGHVHRHPARVWMRHSADTDGTLVSVEARVDLDGGAYRSSSY